ncbi:hypothetical protein [Neisseria sp.]|uniref:hypothetical protein n=1 Tax=Neisseria sp. TaxID=192066 RepID=UPI00289BF4B5|nr:hypothetical protein [Neisseria sp.]
METQTTRARRGRTPYARRVRWLLKRLRKDPGNAHLLQMVHLTINGVAQGLRNTG